MSGLDADLKAARRRQRRGFVAVVVAVPLLAAAAAAAFVLSGGTPVHVSPAEADRLARLHVVEGTGFVLGRRIWSLPGGAVVRVEAEGFLPEEAALPPGGGGGSRFVEVVLREAPGRLHARTRPPAPGVRWLLDGNPIAAAPHLDVELRPGVRSLTADHPYHQRATREVVVKRGEEIRLVVDLQPLRGKLEIASVPPGAAVSIGGQDRGRTPGVHEVGGGEHAVEVTLAGYKPVTDTVRITNTATEARRSYVLPRADAFVTFRLRPPGGRLLLDGRRLRRLEKVRVDALATHSASYLKAGHAPRVMDFALQPGEHATLEMSLRETSGTVEITSVPPASILVDGKPAGSTPRILSLSTVEHTIRIEREGYRGVTRKVTPSARTPRKIGVVLRTEARARLDAAPPAYTNSAGITLRLFTDPGRIAMGAPRGEKGRRANEFPREVRLARAFYAALHEVTAAQFGEFSGAPAPPGGGDLPVTGVSWLDAVRFCNWLSRREGLAPFYRLDGGGAYLGIDRDADGYRLPTEAEWEWLARKAGRGTRTRFSWGDEENVPPASGNLADESARGRVDVYIPNYTDGFPGLAPVGRFNPDKAGVHDLSGNVSEWTHDAYSPVPARAGEEIDPVGDGRGAARVVKGSNWRSATLTELRAAFRESAVGGRDDLGFRVARYLHGGEDAQTR